MLSRIVVIGASGFGREALDVVEACYPNAETHWIVGVVDDFPSSINLQRLASRHVAYLGTLDDLIKGGIDATHYVVGIGAPEIRRRIEARLQSSEMTALTAIHPSASIGSQTRILEGAIICAGAVISTNVTVGRHVHINPSATIGHDAVISDFSSINPSATVSGEVRISSQCLVGAGSIVLQGLSIDAGAVIGAGAVVTKSVPSGVVVKGVPGRW